MCSTEGGACTPGACCLPACMAAWWPSCWKQAAKASMIVMGLVRRSILLVEIGPPAFHLHAIFLKPRFCPSSHIMKFPDFCPVCVISAEISDLALDDY
eukprot:COSAG01_NODE_143_length_24153_cov_54.226116_25_plen_98_part_00